MGERFLIINADDFGLCHSANAAVMELFRAGRVFSSTIMAPAPGAEEAIFFARENPQYAIGVHLTHTNEWQENCPWPSLTGGTSLHNPAGRMWADVEGFERNCDVREAVAECRAQIEKCRALGMEPSHADSHMGAMYGLVAKRSLLQRVLKVCGDYGLPFRMFAKPLMEQCPEAVPGWLYRLMCRASALAGRIYGVAMPDYIVFPEKIETGRCYEEFRENFLRYLTAIPEGISETYVHPALPTDEMKHIAGTWERRGWEYRVMLDEETHKTFRDAGIRLISYRDLKKMRTKNGAP